MKYAPACISLVLAAVFVGGCATRPPAPARPYIFQLAAIRGDGPCDWSLMQDVNEPPSLRRLSLGAAEWPHTVPAQTRLRRSRAVPLQAYGSDTGFQWLSGDQSVCLPLYRRISVWQEGVPPVLTLELKLDQTPEDGQARVLALTSNPTLTKVSIMTQPYGARSDFPPQRLDLSLRNGRAEGRIMSPPDGQSVRVTVVVTEAGGEGQTERALELLSSGERGGRLIVREGSKLVAKPSWPGPGRRSSQPR